MPLDAGIAGHHGASSPLRLCLLCVSVTWFSVALRFGSTLITLDREQRDRAAGVVAARYPVKALAEVA